MKFTKNEQFIFDSIRARFDKWNAADYYRRNPNEQAWRAWCAALLDDREQMEEWCRAHGIRETVPDYQSVSDVQVLRKILEVEQVLSAKAQGETK